MVALHLNLAEEVAEHHCDGAISRRDALRRLAVSGLTATSALAKLAACRRDDDPEAVATDGPTDRTPAGPTPSPTEDIEFARSGRHAVRCVRIVGRPGRCVSVIHENRGLTDHIRLRRGTPRDQWIPRRCPSICCLAKVGRLTSGRTRRSWLRLAARRTRISSPI